MSAKGTITNITFIKDNAPADQYPYDLPFFKNTDTLRIHPHVNFLVGDNGSGKSTLLEAIAVASGFNPEGGTRNFNFTTRASHSPLYQKLRITRDTEQLNDGYFLRAESFFNVASNIEYLDIDEPGSAAGPKVIASYGGTPLHERSHGESFWALFTNRFSGKGLYLLDEPEAALSPARQLEMLGLMHALVLKGAQFIIATHSPIIVSYPHARVFEMDAEGIHVTTYNKTQLFRTYQHFFADPAGLVDDILSQHLPQDH